MNRKPLKATGNLNNSTVQVSAEVIEEEADCDNAAVGTVDRKPVTSDQKFLSFTPSFPSAPVCWLILAVIMALRIYFTSVISEHNAKLTAENQNLTSLINQLSEEKQNLTSLNIKLETQKNQNLKSENIKLSAENQNLTSQNIKLSEEKQNLKTILETQRTVENELYVIDAYCPKPENQKRTCKACQDGWLPSQSSCYAVNNPDGFSDQKTWEEAREYCRGKISDLVVIVDQTERTFISKHSWSSSGTRGYWIGLRAEDGKWKWVDGSDLNNNSWRQELAINGQCVISVLKEGWKSVSCGARNRWICKKKALSV